MTSQERLDRIQELLEKYGDKDTCLYCSNMDNGYESYWAPLTGEFPVEGNWMKHTDWQEIGLWLNNEVYFGIKGKVDEVHIHTNSSSGDYISWFRI